MQLFKQFGIGKQTDSRLELRTLEIWDKKIGMLVNKLENF